MVVYVDESEALTWNEEEVCQRWQQLYHIHPLVEWLQHFGKQYRQAVGSISELSAFAANTEKQWIGGYRQQADIFQ